MECEIAQVVNEITAYEQKAPLNEAISVRRACVATIQTAAPHRQRLFNHTRAHVEHEKSSQYHPYCLQTTSIKT